jgi:hypothetical protein
MERMTTASRTLASTLAALLLSTSAFALPFGGGGGGKPNEFEATSMATPEQLSAQAKKYWKGAGLKKIRAAGYKKAAIVEFSVEYVTLTKSDWTGHGNFGLLDVAQAASGAGKKKVELDEELKRSLPRVLHDAFRDQMIADGYDVKTVEEVVASPAFAQLAGSEDPGKKTTRDEHAYAADKKEKAEIYPVESLMNLKMGAFKVVENTETMAKLASDLGVDVLLRAHFRVGVIKGGRPTLEAGSWISVGAGPTAAGTRYGFAQQGRLDSKDGLVAAEDVTDSHEHHGAKGTIMDVNSDAYQAALLRMFPAYSGMGLSLLDSE